MKRRRPPDDEDVNGARNMPLEALPLFQEIYSRVQAAGHDLSRAHARNSDPATSHEAAEKATLRMNETRRAVWQCFHIQGAEQAAMTDEQMIDRYMSHRAEHGWPMQTESGLRSRRAELVKMGRLMVVGTGTIAATGNRSTVWGPV